MSESFQMETADRFTVGAVGEPGHRVFMVQVTGDGVTHTLKAEKHHAANIAEYFGELLGDLPRPGHLPEELELEPPLEIAWLVDSFAAQWDETKDRISVELGGRATWSEDTESIFGEDDPLTGRFLVTREQAAAFAIRATSLVESGRPPCPLCGYPLESEGHACPRTNGNRPPSL